MSFDKLSLSPEVSMAQGHIIPNLKVLSSGLKPSGGHGHGCTFEYYHTILNSTHFAYKQAK